MILLVGAWLNSVYDDPGFTQVVEFLMDFHSPVKEEMPSAWTLDKEYTDFQWWLARTEDGDWEVATWGY